MEYYKHWGVQVNQHLEKCKKIISDIKLENKTIVAFGAAAKGCIFLNAINLTDKEIEYIIDDTDIKQGKYMPGTGLKIVGRDNIDFNKIQEDGYLNKIEGEKIIFGEFSLDRIKSVRERLDVLRDPKL